MNSDETKALLEVVSNFSISIAKTNDIFLKLQDTVSNISPKMKEIVEENSKEMFSIIDDNFKALNKDLDRYKDVILKLELQYEQDLEKLSTIDIEAKKHEYEMEKIKLQNKTDEGNNKRDNWFRLFIKILALIAFGTGMYISGNTKLVSALAGFFK